MASGWTHLDTLLLLLLVLLAIVVLIAEGQPAPRYMVLYQGSAGLNFRCTDELPYDLDQMMVWDEALGATELDEYGRLIAQIVQVDECNLDNIYVYRQRHYTWRFASHQTDEHPDHRHIVRGAWWIQWREDDIQ